jgi:hypothetical protein
MTRRAGSHPVLRSIAAGLLIGVTYIHLADQNFLAFDKGPGYLLAGYILVEIAAPLTAVFLLLKPVGFSWVLALGCSAGPLAGFLATRTVGLPGSTEDIGNWGEPLGVASILVEGTLALVAVAIVVRALRTHRAELGATVLAGPGRHPGQPQRLAA